ncbi:hypothetical protein D6D22_10769 [Aureobasidium pullulans]|uniref:Tyrosine specific protein phosphatases domain-containing protein n=1 Tax=Aureobasidium pullulans TaxID=5580 RepID=A0A4V6T964_AURPU|nr:hypothetical protein D6D22_10769 [Aureobasidium pullulans]
MDLPTIHNFRDVGKVASDIKAGLIFRSGHADDATSEEYNVLRDHYKIRTVIDLRGMRQWPFLTSTNKVPGQSCNHIPQYPQLVAYTNVLGLSKYYIQLNGPEYNKHQSDKLNWVERAKLLTEGAMTLATGPPSYPKRISLHLTKDRMSAAKDMIQYSGPQIKALFQVLANSSSYPLVLMDTWGVGHTSLAICLILLFLEVDEQNILREYRQSDQELAVFRDKRKEDLRAAGVPEDWVDSDPRYVDVVQRHLQATYGGIKNYLLGTGLSVSELRMVHSCLRHNASLSEKQGSLVDI